MLAGHGARQRVSAFSPCDLPNYFPVLGPVPTAAFNLPRFHVLERESPVALVVALLIFTALSAATWFVAHACYKSTCADGPNTPAPPGRSVVSACAIGPSR